MGEGKIIETPKQLPKRDTASERIVRDPAPRLSKECEPDILTHIPAVSAVAQLSPGLLAYAQYVWHTCLRKLSIKLTDIA